MERPSICLCERPLRLLFRSRMRANEAAGDFGWWLARWTSSSSPTLKPGSAAFALRGKQQDGDRGGSTGLHTLDPDKNAQWLKEAKAREEALRAARLRRAAAAARPEDRPSTESLLREQVRRREEEQDYNRRYKKAARKWISTVAALPILLVTSYGLFDRFLSDSSQASASQRAKR